MSDALAELGLNLEGEATETEASTVDTAAVAAEVTAEAKTRAPRVEVNVGEIVVAEADDLPESTRKGNPAFGKRESKYPFDKIEAPVLKEDGVTYKYHSMVLTLQEGVDPDALKRSVQSATTQANSTYKAEGRRFKSYSTVVDGAFVGMKVFRVDDKAGK